MYDTAEVMTVSLVLVLRWCTYVF